MSDCLFCKIVAGEIPADIVHQDDQVVVFRDINPKAKVHLLVIPRIHVTGLNGINSEHDALMAHMLRLLPELAAREGLETGFRTIINTGKGGGQEVFHLHIHLLGGDDLPGF
ncbi:histidine triad nucleotide-binding protein [Solemya pervernicosa gill symbiont]|uniref:Histidine triad nucleotide-binding protein n=2 Tax=Gammaproteobacteria incertae sedis TaxID=118884 RepID=A0A1T2L7D0_9GAMM|nr:histidine triad nucleotide-binding protein [Candidatus Reidiella endopervernicosa]OOZ40962.1 histidine triad nucleotide-binding protein [Solemya pervernicosa gill symbiont]QKQ25010.1 histidine triad nucleotide-binding protein [Candidatus Reidiella endopervernicosa]